MKFSPDQIEESLTSYLAYPSRASRQVYDNMLLETLNDFVAIMPESATPSGNLPEQILQRYESYIKSPIAVAIYMIVSERCNSRLHTALANANKENGSRTLPAKDRENISDLITTENANDMAALCRTLLDESKKLAECHLHSLGLKVQTPHSKNKKLLLS